jgi:hypothetical protein
VSNIQSFLGYINNFGTKAGREVAAASALAAIFTVIACPLHVALLTSPRGFAMLARWVGIRSQEALQEAANMVANTEAVSAWRPSSN